MDKKTVVSNMAWRFAERVGAQIVKLIVEIVLARMLLPDDYGLIALVTVFITILNVFVDSGLGNALIQKKNADDLDFSSVFWFNIFLCIILYIGLFFASPIIASFYNRQELVPVIRVLGIQIIISGVKNVQQAYVSRTMQFKRFFFATIWGTLGAAGIGIWMAYCGCGVWALVAQQLFNVLVDTIILWITVKWRPIVKFSYKKFKGLFSFGWKLFLSSLIDNIYNEICQLVIGKKYTSESLAYYNRGNQFPKFFVGNVNDAIGSVLLPTMSKVQDDKNHIKTMTRRAITTSIYVMAPLMMGLAFAGEVFVRLLLTEKWIFCVPYLRICCLIYMFYPIHTVNLNAIKAMGRSDLFLKLEIIKKSVDLLVLIFTMNISVKVMVYGFLATSIICQIINSWPNRKLLGYSYIDQLKDILPSIVISLIMGGIITIIGFLNLPDLATLIIQIAIGSTFYILISKLLRLESYIYVKEVIKSFKYKVNA